KDKRFEKTWLRQREDLKDQSQSGYDMALAGFGAGIGLSEQQMVDLMIHHRRIHSQRPRTRLDYIQRTIAKAYKQADGTGSIRSFPSSATAPALAEAGSQVLSPDSETDGAQLCEQISNLLGVPIRRILKMTGKEPTYQIELETVKIELPNVGRLLDQRSLRMAIASGADLLIPKVKPVLWEKVARMSLGALAVQDSGQETDLVGSVRLYLKQYLSETRFIESVGDETDSD
ncbi:MAG TPA: hypothetical protein VEQ63_09395, partial [Bryobacteraceae bacterium]|nr:hypothetical protein [Bryobacteraceae bacterium]